MPELDRFEQSFPRGWSRPYRLARSAAASAQECNDSIVIALWDSLREHDGVPGFASLVGVLECTGACAHLAQFAAIEEIVRTHVGHRHTEIAAGVAKSLLIRQAADDGFGSDRAIVEHFATETCWGLLDNYFFANARCKLIEEGALADPAAAHRWQRQTHEDLRPRIERIAVELIGNPDAVGLHRPRRTAPLQSTKDLLNDNLLSQERQPLAPSNGGRS